jgi:alginate O-acetyltransferase complex protein AlgI
MWITMIVSGFWHGTSWNFVVWGWLQALFLSMERWFKWPKWLNQYHLKGFAVFLVIVQVLLA